MNVTLCPGVQLSLVSLVSTAGFLEVCSNGSGREPARGEESKEVQRVQMGQLEETMGPVACMTVCVGGGGGGGQHIRGRSSLRLC